MEYRNIEKFSEKKLERKYTILTPKTSKTSDFTDLSELRNAIFLAGPCPRKASEPDWREEAFDILATLCFSGIVLNPTNRYYDENNPKERELQVAWELEAMMRASAVVFWLPRSEQSPGFTSNVEVGYWIGKKGVFIGMLDDCMQNANAYIKTRTEMSGQDVYNTLNDLLAATVRDLHRGTETFFTSDTHFGQERTMNLSRRPFSSVKEMDLTIISNWNKTVRMSDVVYHLGDFGADASYLKGLNYGEFNLVKGNYETDVFKNVAKDIKAMPNCHIYSNDEKELQVSDSRVYTLRHQPINPKGNGKVDKSKFYLFGHIHGKSLYMKNGLEVGTDAHNYCPVSLEEVNWRVNGILNYSDENCFTPYCK